MPELRTGAYVDPASTSAGRNSLGVVIEGKFDTVFITANQGGLKHVDGGLGFQNDAVFQGAKRSFADRLYQLSLELDKRVAEGQNKLKSLSGEAYDQEVLSLLTLTKARSETSLTKLQELGYGLRQKLNQKFVDVLTALGGMKESYLDEPAINFYNHQQLPVLWDMMYEAKAPFEDVEWQRFWGFRFPLTHWDATGRSEHKIRLKQGLFSAID